MDHMRWCLQTRTQPENRADVLRNLWLIESYLHYLQNRRTFGQYGRMLTSVINPEIHRNHSPKMCKSGKMQLPINKLSAVIWKKVFMRGKFFMDLDNAGFGNMRMEEMKISLQRIMIKGAI